MKNLIIIGAGGLGREVYGFAEGNAANRRDWIVKGFLDDRPNALTNTPRPVGIIGSVEDYQPLADDLFITAIMNPRQREKYSRIIQERGGEFINLIDGSSSLGINVKMGVGNIICWQAAISCDIEIGNFVVMNTLVNVGHDCKIEDYVSLHNRCLIGGRSVLKKYSEVCSNATILPGALLEEGAVVGAGSVLLKKAPAGRTMMGVPAKPLEF